MELRTYGQHNEHLSGVMFDSLQFVEKKRNSDSRYRSIVTQLDAMMELLIRQPDRKLTTEMDHLLDDMMHHVGSENRFMELMDYPQALEHRNNHYSIFIMTDDLSQRCAMGQKVLLEDIGNIHLLWMIHIQRHDRAFEEFLVF